MGIIVIILAALIERRSALIVLFVIALGISLAGFPSLVSHRQTMGFAVPSFGNALAGTALTVGVAVLIGRAIRWAYRKAKKQETQSFFGT